MAIKREGVKKKVSHKGYRPCLSYDSMNHQIHCKHSGQFA